MTEEIFACKCGFKCVVSTLYKTDGACPKCGLRSAKNKEKFDGSGSEKTTLHLKGGN